MSSDEDNRAKLWGVDPEVLKREEEKHQQNPASAVTPSAPKEDKTQDDAARLGIELPPLPQWASEWVKRPMLKPIDLDEGFRKYTPEQKRLMVKFPMHCLVFCQCCSGFGVVLLVGQEVIHSRLGTLSIVTLQLANGKGDRHATIEDRVQIVGYKRGLEPAVMEALFNPPSAVN